MQTICISSRVPTHSRVTLQRPQCEHPSRRRMSSSSARYCTDKIYRHSPQKHMCWPLVDGITNKLRFKTNKLPSDHSALHMQDLARTTEEHTTPKKQRGNSLSAQHYYVYSLQCRHNNGVYIGSTVQSLKERLTGHASQPPVKMKSDVKLFAAQGWSFRDSFSIQLLHDVPDIESAFELEALETRRCMADPDVKCYNTVIGHPIRSWRFHQIQYFAGRHKKW